MLNIAICDDDTEFCFQLIQHFQTYYSDIINLINEYSNGEELLKDIKSNNLLYDFILLDLEMPHMNGIETGQELRKLSTHQNTIIMFVTSFDSNPVPIVDIHPFAYIKKPIDITLLDEKFKIALKHFFDSEKYIILSTPKMTLRLFTKEIVYIESFGRHSIIHTSSDNIEFNMRLSDTQKALEAQSDAFVRIHASFLLNISYIGRVTPSNVILKNSKILPLSRTYKNSFLQIFKDVVFH